MIKIYLNWVYKGYDGSIVIPVQKVEGGSYLCIKNMSENNDKQAQILYYDDYGNCYAIPYMNIKKHLPRYNSEYIQNKKLIQKMKKICKEQDVLALKNNNFFNL